MCLLQSLFVSLGGSCRVLDIRMCGVICAGPTCRQYLGPSADCLVVPDWHLVQVVPQGGHSSCGLWTELNSVQIGWT